MKRVLLDVDGVLADFVGGYLKLLEEHCGVAAKHEQVTGWKIDESLGLTWAQSVTMKRAIGAAPQFARSLAVLPGAVDGVKALQKVADVYIVTSPWNSNPTWCHDREWWLKEHFGIPHSRVTHTSAKHLMRGDYLVDDKTETCDAFRVHTDGTPIQWQTPHNRRDTWLGWSTNDWAELVRWVAIARKS